MFIGSTGMIFCFRVEFDPKRDCKPQHAPQTTNDMCANGYRYDYSYVIAQRYSGIADCTHKKPTPRRHDTTTPRFNSTKRKRCLLWRGGQNRFPCLAAAHTRRSLTLSSCTLTGGINYQRHWTKHKRTVGGEYSSSRFAPICVTCE